MLKNIGLTELIIVGVVLILLFGRKKTKELAKDTGQAAKELKKIKNEFKETIEEIKKEPVPDSNKSVSKRKGGVKNAK